MKKAISILLTIIITFSFTACTQNSNNNNKESTHTSQATPSENTTSSKTDEKILVVYFTWSGNTKKMAKTIQEHTGADILEIEPSVPYPNNYNECGELAKKERDENARPKIANLPESIDNYSTIFIGYPIWWHTAPMIIGTFLESYDLTDKNIYPFTQSSSMDKEQFQNSMEFVKENAKGATVHEGLFVNASDTESIITYLTDNEILFN